MLARIENLECRRLLSAGDVDRTFGLNGAVAAAAWLPGSAEFTRFQPVAVLPAAAGTSVVVSLAAPWDSPPSVFVASRVVVARFGGDGKLDSAFGERGYAMVDIGDGGGSFGAAAATLDGQGRVVVGAVVDAAGAGDFRLAALRLTPGGKPDASFGSRGRVVLPFGGFDPWLGARVAVGAGDRVVLAATRRDPLTDLTSIVVARVRADGSADTTFDGDGKRTLPVDRGSAQAIAVDGSNRVLVAGAFGGGAFVTRLTAAGLPDRSFDARLAGSVDGEVADLAALPDGRIVLSGALGGDAFVARFRGDGTRDPGFGGGDGIVVARDYFAEPNAPARFLDLFPAADGQLYAVAAGAFPNGGARSIAKFRANGAVERGYGVAGLAALPAGLDVNAIVARRSDTTFNVVRPGVYDPAAGATATEGLQVYRLTPWGQLDTTYRMSGFAIAREVASSHYGGTNLFVDASGRLVTAGVTGTGAFAVYRYARDGKPDTAFAAAGLAVVEEPDDATFNGHLAMPTGDGRIILRADGFDTQDHDGIGLMLRCLRPDGLTDVRWTLEAGYFSPSGDETHDGRGGPLPGGWFTGSWEESWNQGRRTVVVLDARGARRLWYSGAWPDGEPDPTLGGRYFEPTAAIPIGPDAAGGYFVSGIAVAGWGGAPAEPLPVIRRITPQGQPNPAFDGDGTKLGFSGVPLAAQPDGSLLYARPGTRALFRLKPDGTPDLTFGSGGGAAWGFDHFDVDSAGRIIAWRQLAGGVADGDVQVVRLTANGKADASFGGGDGLVVVDTGLPSGGSLPGVLVTPADQIVVTSVRRSGDQARWFATRLLA